MSKTEGRFTFEISLSVLDDLGRKLYRSFATVLGEAISNSWDADADNVWIYVNKEENSFVIKDDGDGMDANDFQNKFLRIGYSKRRDMGAHSRKGRPFIGRKGIGKLALLSCAETVSVMSKTLGGNYVDGLIDNRQLDKAIRRDLTPSKYPLPRVNTGDFKKYVRSHKKGTIIYFANMKEGIRNSVGFLRKVIALYFRFSLVDKDFKIYLDDDPITVEDLKDLADRTEFLWTINSPDDPFAKESLMYDKRNKVKEQNLLEPPRELQVKEKVKGFIASVRKPTDLKVFGTDERIGVDLFVNGRLREKDILRHIPTAKVPENYLYGQIHYDGLDDAKDRFSTSREGIVADDVKFERLLARLQDTLATVIDDWDELRTKNHKEGDSENPRMTRRERKAAELYDVVSKEYAIDEDPYRPGVKAKVDDWIGQLFDDAKFNFPSYADCYLSENLVRKHIEEKRTSLTEEAKRDIEQYRLTEKTNKEKGNVSIEIRRNPNKLTYLSMDGLATLVDNKKSLPKEASLSRDAAEYKPLRDAVMHTALLTDEAQERLKSVRQNIKGRVRTLLATG